MEVYTARPTLYRNKSFVYDELGHHLLTPPFLLGQRWTTLALAHDCGAANQTEQHHSHSAPNFLWALSRTLLIVIIAFKASKLCLRMSPQMLTWKMIATKRRARQ